MDEAALLFEKEALLLRLRGLLLFCPLILGSLRFRLRLCAARLLHFRLCALLFLSFGERVLRFRTALSLRLRLCAPRLLRLSSRTARPLHFRLCAVLPALSDLFLLCLLFP